MHVEIVAQSGGGGSWILLVILGELGESVVCLAVDDGAFFNPADLVLLGLYLDKAAAVFEDFKLLAVGDHGDALADGGHAVMQIHLPRGDVHAIVIFVLKALAARGQPNKSEHSDQARKRKGPYWSAAAFQSMA